MTASATPTAGAHPGPLAGVRVLDLIDGLGAYGPKLLAALGARVIRVEPPDGARHRRRPPFYTAVDVDANPPSLYYFHYNAAKQGITLDTGRQEGRALLRRLLDAVEIVLDNGELARWGMDPRGLAEKSPPLVVVSVTPFGLTSARSHWQGGDLICQAMSGMIGLFGFRGERPARFGPEQASEIGGLAAALGALIALFGMRTRGGGEFIDIAVERAAALVTFQMSNASIYHQFGYTKQRTPRADGLRGVLYETKDGFVTLGAYRRLDELMAMLEEAGAAEDLPALRAGLPEPEFIASPHVEQVVRRFAAGLTRAELVERAQAHGMLGLPVHDVADLLADPFLQERAFFVDVPHPELETVLTYTGAPMRFSATPYQIDRRPPLLGEHNDVVYGGLGLDGDELARLRAEGVV